LLKVQARQISVYYKGLHSVVCKLLAAAVAVVAATARGGGGLDVI